MRPTLEEQTALAAKWFPAKWAQASSQTGRKAVNARRNLRHAAVQSELKAPLMAAGATCSTCKHKLTNPAGLKGLYCELDSDFHGYVTTKPEDLCSRYEGPRKP